MAEGVGNTFGNALMHASKRRPMRRSEQGCGGLRRSEPGLRNVSHARKEDACAHLQAALLHVIPVVRGARQVVSCCADLCGIAVVMAVRSADPCGVRPRGCDALPALFEGWRGEILVAASLSHLSARSAACESHVPRGIASRVRGIGRSDCGIAARRCGGHRPTTRGLDMQFAEDLEIRPTPHCGMGPRGLRSAVMCSDLRSDLRSGGGGWRTL